MAKKRKSKRAKKAAKLARKKAKRQVYLSERVRRDPDYLQTMPYSRYLGTNQWAELREQVLHRDAYICQNCHAHAGDPRVRLEVHHKTYERRGHELLSDLVTLCSRCHELVHASVAPDDLDILHRRGGVVA